MEEGLKVKERLKNGGWGFLLFYVPSSFCVHQATNKSNLVRVSIQNYLHFSVHGCMSRIYVTVSKQTKVLGCTIMLNVLNVYVFSRRLTVSELDIVTVAMCQSYTSSVLYLHTKVLGFWFS
jgi:hypothetical protein